MTPGRSTGHVGEAVADDDPMVPAQDRLPRELWPPLRSDEIPSSRRPWGLRRVRSVDGPMTARHRTSPHDTPQKTETVNDGTKSDDTWTTPDD